MKKTIQRISGIALMATLALASCDKVEQPNIPVEGVDTSLYPGVWAEYTIPAFGENTNTQRNILIEDFTGHKCGACPGAAIIAADLEDANPGRVFVASIHAGPSNTGITSFQTVQAPDYPRDFTTEEGLEIAATFFQLGVGFAGNPRGSINRIAAESGAFLFNQGEWVTRTNDALATSLKLNIQAKSNYYEETNGVFLHVESQFLESMSGDYSLVVYAIQNDVVSPQLIGTERDEDYHHHNVHIGNVFGETWGRTIASGDIQSGTKITTDLSYEVPEGLTNEDMHFQIYVYDKSTYEILQVIEHEF